ncbi:MAG: ATP phosphoribosyltransferase regulatory subunit, partial [Clostridiales bacterium]|nr:ATP phosphoribosyltransferase regulatory subunit [Clostridiales bacterium]
NKLANNPRSKAALKNLYAVYEILDDYGLSKYITFDLGMIHSINYYTGIIFRGITDKLGYPICGGGRYDNLVSDFGYDIPATGFALGIKRLLIALERQGDLEARPNIDVLIVFDRQNRQRGYSYMKELRQRGERVEHFLVDESSVDAKKYARSKSIKRIIRLIGEYIEEEVIT